MKLAASAMLLALLVLDLSLAWAGLRSPIVDNVSIPGAIVLVAITLFASLVLLKRSRYSAKSKFFAAAGYVAVVLFSLWVMSGDWLSLSRRISDEMLGESISGVASIEISEKLSLSEVDRVKRSTTSDWKIAFCNPLWKQFDYVLITDSEPVIGIRVTMPHGFAQGGSVWAYHETTFDAQYMASGRPIPVGRCE